MYGLLISTAIIASSLFLERNIKKQQKDTSLLWGLIFVATVGGIIGARIYHVLDFYNFYAQNPHLILQIWRGGLGIWGAIFGAFILSSIYLYKKKQPILFWLDQLALVAPFIQSVGRWGNYFNKELYGKTTDSFLGMSIDKSSIKYHPLFLYESILNLFLFGLLLVVSKKKTQLGSILILYLIGYSVIRLFLEEFRVQVWKIYGLNVAQLISILTLVLCSTYLIYVKAKSK